MISIYIIIMYKNALDRYLQVEPCIRMVSEDGKRKVKEKEKKKKERREEARQGSWVGYSP